MCILYRVIGTGLSNEIRVCKMHCKGMVRGYDKFYVRGEDVNRDFTEEVLKDEEAFTR